MNLLRTVALSKDSSLRLCLILRLILLSVVLSLSPSVSFAAWQDWFQTPEQRAAELLESGDAQTLIDSAPSESWKGHGHFQAGELDAATASFEQAREMADESGNSTAVERALFNAATTNVHNGRLDEAINQFDELLELNPDHEKALHNKEVAEKIRVQQEQEQQAAQQSGGEGEQGDEKQDSESGEQQEGQPDNGQDGQQDREQDGEQGDSDETGETGEQSADQSSSQDDANEGQQASADESESDRQQQQAGQDGQSDESSEEAARAALEAEQRLNDEQAQAEAEDAEAGDREESVGITAQESDTPLTEQQQATEQWLRQIPDDPAGLLRNKLQQSHRLEYPGVQSSEERW